MSENSKSKSKAELYRDARKMQQGHVLSKKPEEDDDSGGGGAGKRMQGSFKLEKLLKVLTKGLQKIQKFGKFLIKNRLDSHETKKTTLGKQKEQATKVAEKLETFKELKENQEHAQEIQKEHEQFVEERETAEAKTIADGGTDENSWQKAKAKAVDDRSPLQRFSFQDVTTPTQTSSASSIPASFDTEHVAQITRDIVMEQGVPGAVFNGTANHHGFIKHSGNNSTFKQNNNAAQSNNAQKSSNTKLNKNQNSSSIIPNPVTPDTPFTRPMNTRGR